MAEIECLAIGVKAQGADLRQQIGMGVAFVDPPEEQLKTLDSWLAGLAPAKNV